MPRSYSFDHFKAVNPGKVHGIREHEKQAVSLQEKADAPAGEPKIHYGKRHAETEELFKAKHREMEELAGSERMPPRRAEAPGESPRGEEVREPRAARTAPIGALPAHPEPPPPASLLREVYDEVDRHLRVLRVATRDIGRSSWRLVTLPLEVARMVARRLRNRPA